MTRIWTIDARTKQAARIRMQKPWVKSTGPKTEMGKRMSSRNSCKHGGYSIEIKTIKFYLRTQKHYIATLRLLLKMGRPLPAAPNKNMWNELNTPRTNPYKNDTVRLAFLSPITTPHHHFSDALVS